VIEGDNFMYQSILRNIFILVLVVIVSPMPQALGDDISGSDRVMCAALHATRCSADPECQTGSPRLWNIPDFIEFDFIKKHLQTTKASGTDRITPIPTLIREEGKIFIQGIEKERVFSIVIDVQSGNLTAAVATDGKAVSAFGVCTPLL